MSAATALSAPGRRSLFKGLKPILYGGREVWPLIEGGKGVSRDQPRQLGRLGGGGRHRHGQRGQRRQLRSRRPDHPADLRGADPPRAPRRTDPICDRRRGRAGPARLRNAPAARARSTSTCCGKWAARSACCTASSSAPRAWSRGVTCGAGMPYKLSEIAASYGVNYLPIISSARAFSALWKRAYHKAAEWLAAVVYEDPWLAGGHNGLSQRRGPAQAAGSLSARQGAARDDARAAASPTACRSSWPAASGGSTSGTTGSTIPSSARSSSSSERGRC